MSTRKYNPAPEVQSEVVTLETTDPLAEVFESIAKVYESSTTHTMAEGENILTVARLYLPKGMTRSEYANRLVKTNPSFAVGRIINLV